MLTCKQVSRTLHNEDYADLSPIRKLLLKLHIKLCIVCGKFNKQVIKTQDMCCHYKQHEEEAIARQPGMDSARKDALKQIIAEQAGVDANTPRT